MYSLHLSLVIYSYLKSCKVLKKLGQKSQFYLLHPFLFDFAIIDVFTSNKLNEIVGEETIDSELTHQKAYQAFRSHIIVATQ